MPDNLDYALPALVLLLIVAYFIKYLRPALLLLFGFVYVWISVNNYLSSRLEPQFEGKDINLNGVVSGIPAKYSNRMSFVLKVNKAMFGDINLPLKKLRLSWYGKTHDLLPGQIVKLTARLKSPRGLVNAAGFDYGRWLFQTRIDATGYVRDKQPVVIIGQSDKLIDKLHVMRFGLKQKLKSLVQNQKLEPLLLALTIGDRSGMSRQHWQVLQATGTSHLLAISGLHLGLVAAGMFFILSKLLSLVRIDLIRLNLLQFASFGALSVSAVYALLAGLSIPTQRALIMLATGFLLILLRRRINPLLGLLWAMLACVLFDPLSILSAGFWLSFAAVFWILILLKFYKSRNAFSALVKIQFVLALGLLPILNGFDLPISSISIPANLVILPIISIIGLPLLLLVSIFMLINDKLATWVIKVVEMIFDWCWQFLEFIKSFNLSAISFPTFELWQIVLALVAFFFIMLPRGFPGKHIFWFLLIPVFSGNGQVLENNMARISVLDVGQGLAVLVETKNHNLLYDTGPKYGSGSSAYSRVIRPVLKHKNINLLDKLILSHLDSDHAGGIEDLVIATKVGEFLTTKKAHTPKLQKSICEAGKKWLWDGVEFSILHPAANTDLDGNNASCVLKISTNNFSMLLVGDVEKAAEYKMVDAKDNLKADVLLLAHHGSKTSSTSLFLDSVKPDFAIISSAYKNKHKFPHKKVARRLKERRIKTFNTAYDGAVEIMLQKNMVKVEGLRQKNKKLWR